MLSQTESEKRTLILGVYIPSTSLYSLIAVCTRGNERLVPKPADFLSNYPREKRLPIRLLVKPHARALEMGMVCGGVGPIVHRREGNSGKNVNSIPVKSVHSSFKITYITIMYI